jgi:hypothetical protein
MYLMRMKKPSLQPQSFRRLPPSERASQNPPLERVLGKTLDVTLQRRLALANFFQLEQTNDQPSTIHISDDQRSL